MSEEKCVKSTVAWISLDIKFNNIVKAEEQLQMCSSVIFEFSSRETKCIYTQWAYYSLQIIPPYWTQNIEQEK